MRFPDFGLSEPILRALTELGYETPTPIQEGTIAMLLKDRDVVGQAQTGTGKTAAFMLPILSGSIPSSGDVQALVLRPTRELALQVADASRSFAKYHDGVDVVPVYGGAPIREQIDRLAARRPGRGRHARPRARPADARQADPRRRAAWSCSTRPTRCCRWASSTTSRAILRRAPSGPPDRTLLRHDARADPQARGRGAALPRDRQRDARGGHGRADRAAPAGGRSARQARRHRPLLERRTRAARSIFARTKIGCQRLADDLPAAATASARCTAT